MIDTWSAADHAVTLKLMSEPVVPTDPQNTMLDPCGFVAVVLRTAKYAAFPPVALTVPVAVANENTAVARVPLGFPP